ncbi:MAG: 8-oxo-dGTP diphosphatase [Clostridia bacterium]|nr:8-oxo-dGTP diphosphatase [Clostridia bacterium]
MRETTLCYLEKDGQYLMLYRNAKAHDPNKGKWIGLGGKLEAGETPEQCVCREILEETGLTLTAYEYRGIVDFQSDRDGEERMHLFTATAWTGTLTACDEGELRWVPKTDLVKLPGWEGDAVFLRALDRGDPFFKITLTYRNNHLVGTQAQIPYTEEPV